MTPLQCVAQCTPTVGVYFKSFELSDTLLGFKHTSVETEINKKMSRMKKRHNFHPVLVREKNSTRKAADISRRHQTYVLIPRFRK